MAAAEDNGLLAAICGCCCGGAGFGEELYRDWDSHPACQQYTTLNRLGEGGFAEVHLAQDKLTGRTVALKVVFLNKAGLTKEQRKILAGEARLVRMVAHPHIVRCHQVLETRRQQVLVLEHLSGGEMLRQLQRMKRYSEANACQLFKQIADAVAYLHSLGIMHRDIKPENCLLAKPVSHYAAKNKPVKVKLIDLGMAGLYRPKRPVKGCMGSPGFIAPEVILGEAHSPAMDVYSLGVLLFIMLVGRKPWDAQRSHTLAYAVQPTSEAPGLRDPVFAASLSAPAKQLLLWMLHEDPSRRPSAQQVLRHSWMLQGGCCKEQADTTSSAAAASTAAAAATAIEPRRVYQQVVQQRLQVLSRSRDIMGTARGMMLLHGSGSRSQAVMFHRAVKAARLQLQQQAAALQASGQMPSVAEIPADIAGVSAACNSLSQQQQQTEQQQQVVSGAVPREPAAAAGSGPSDGMSHSSAPVPQGVGGSSSSGGGGVPASRASAAGALTSTTAATAAAHDDAASGEPAAARRQKPATVAQLAREDLQRRHSLLFGALQQQQQQQQQVAALQQQQQKAGSKLRGSALPGGHQSSTAAGGRRPAGSQGGAGLSASGGNSSSGAAASGAAPGGAAGGIDLSHLHVVALERGMSAPNADMLPFSPPGGGAGAGDGGGGQGVTQRRLEWAVSVSPGALALLDADDQLCLLQAATSMEDESATLLAAGMLSWGQQRGAAAADMLASFREHYPLKPVVRSIARFGQSLSHSLGRSLRSPKGLLSAAASGDYLDAAAAAAAAQRHTGEVSPVQHSAASKTAEAAEGARGGAGAGADSCYDGKQPHQQQQSRQPRGVLPGVASSAAATLQQRLPQTPQLQHELQQHAPGRAAVVGRHTTPAAAAAQHVLQLLQPQQSSQEESLEQPAAFLGNTLSLESSQAQPCLWEMSVDAFSPTGSVRCSDADLVTSNDTQCHMSLAAAHGDEGDQQQMVHHHHHQQQQHGSSVWQQQHSSHAGHRVPYLLHQHQQQQQQQQEQQQQQHSTTPHSASAHNAAASSTERHRAIADAPPPPAAVEDAGIARLSFGADMDIARASVVSAASSGSRPSAFATFGGFAAATAAAALDGAILATGNNSPVRPHPAADAQGNSVGGASMLAALQSPSLRAAATAAAARAEEEGVGLPNGLWLQQSQSVNSSTAAALLRMLSTDATTAATAAAGGDDDAGVLSEAGSAALMLRAGSSRTMSGPLSPKAGDTLPHSDCLAASGSEPQDTHSSPAVAAVGDAGAAAAAVEQQQAQNVDAAGVPSAAATGLPAASTEGVVLRVSHSRHISMMSWLPGAEELAAEQLQEAQPVSPAATDSAAAGSAAAAATDGVAAGSTTTGQGVSMKQPTAGADPAGRAGSSRAVSVPHTSAVAARRHHSRHPQPWLGLSQQQQQDLSTSGRHRHSSDDSSVTQPPQGLAAAGAADGGGARGDRGVRSSTLEHAPSAAASSLDQQEFYVGSFWSPTGLAAQAAGGGGVGRQRQQQHKHHQPQHSHDRQSVQTAAGFLLPTGSMSSLERLDSVQDSLALLADTPSITLELDDDTTNVSGLPSPQQMHRQHQQGAAQVDEGLGDIAGGGIAGVRSCSSSNDGGNRLATEGAGVSEGGSLEDCCLPQPDSSPGAAAVLVRVHSGADRLSWGGSAGTGNKRGTAATAAAAAAETTTAAAAKHSWTAKDVVDVSRRQSQQQHQQQQQQQQPQFDAFDELQGAEWFYSSS